MLNSINNFKRANIKPFDIIASRNVNYYLLNLPEVFPSKIPITSDTVA
jgi:hypothetical protein